MYLAEATKHRPKSGVDQAFSAVLVLRSTSSSESSFSLCKHACEPNNGLSCDEACLCLYHYPVNVPMLMKKARPLPRHVEIVLALLMKSTRPLPPHVEIVLVVMLQTKLCGISDMLPLLAHCYAPSQYINLND